MEAATVAHTTARRVGRITRGAGDGDLVARLRAGDDTAFEAIYDRHHRGLLAFCRHMLSSREEAEDALQHVFIAVHRNLRSTDRPVVLKPWLYAVARNRCLNMLAARRERTSLEDVPEPSTDGLAVAGAVERREDLQALLGDVAALPDDQRAALLLAELGDLSHDEIADALEVRRDKVKALVYQARTSLMSARDARETDCRTIQEQLATMRGADLRRVTLRKHVAMCPSCAAFKADVRRQRAALALVLPVLPAATLKGSVFSAVFGSGGAVGATATAGTAGAGGILGAGVAKTIATVALVGAVGGGGVVAVTKLEQHHRTTPAPSAAPASHGAPAAGARRAPSGTTGPAATHRAAAAPGRNVAATRRGAAHGPGLAAGAGTSATAPATPQANGSPHNAFGQQTAASHGKKLGQSTHVSTPVRAHGAPVKPAHPAHPAKPAHPVAPVHPAKPVSTAPPGAGAQGNGAAAAGSAKPATGHAPPAHQPATAVPQVAGTATTGS